MKTTKTVIRRNLPINDTYKIIDSYYTGSLMDGGGTCCNNCNKLITNVAVIENKNGVKYNVGLDCAETLCSISDLYETSNNFNESKSIRAKVNKAIKAGLAVEISVNKYGKIAIYCAGKFNEVLLIDWANKYMPDYVAKVTNPSKLTYVYKEYNFDLNFDKKSLLIKDARHLQTIEINGYVCNVSIIAKKHNEHTNYHYQIEVLKDSTLIGLELTYNYVSIESLIKYIIAEYEFNNF